MSKDQENIASSSKPRVSSPLGRNPGRALIRIGSLIFGAWISYLFISFFSPANTILSDSVKLSDAESNANKNQLDISNSVILFALLNNKNNHNKFKLNNRFIHSEVLSSYVIQFSPRKFIHTLKLPEQLPLKVPERKVLTTTSIFSLGGPSLLSNAVQQAFDFPTGQPQRFLTVDSAEFRLLMKYMINLRKKLQTDSVFRRKISSNRANLSIQRISKNSFNDSKISSDLLLFDSQPDSKKINIFYEHFLTLILNISNTSSIDIFLREVYNQVDTNLTFLEFRGFIFKTLKTESDQFLGNYIPSKV